MLASNRFHLDLHAPMVHATHDAPEVLTRANKRAAMTSRPLQHYDGPKTAFGRPVKIVIASPDPCIPIRTENIVWLEFGQSRLHLFKGGTQMRLLQRSRNWPPIISSTQ